MGLDTPYRHLRRQTRLNNIPGCLLGSTFVYSEVFKLHFSSASHHSTLVTVHPAKDFLVISWISHLLQPSLLDSSSLIKPSMITLFLNLVLSARYPSMLHTIHNLGSGASSQLCKFQGLESVSIRRIQVFGECRHEYVVSFLMDTAYWLSKETYSHKVELINETNYWEKFTCPTTLLPPKHHVHVGRLKKKRKRSKHEDKPFMKDGKLRRKNHYIKSCENIRHNKATCKAQGQKATGGLFVVDCACGACVGVGSQGSSHTRWTKKIVQTVRISPQKTTPKQPASQPSTNSQVLVTETRNADEREMSDGIQTQSSAAGGASECLAFGKHLEEKHMTWARFGKKRDEDARLGFTVRGDGVKIDCDAVISEQRRRHHDL
uniref:Uncharacterized protein n=1 Tax=Tanacetum cinerariifolium TaxID=118510 RepID=A0A6L2J7K4_TANCI|nr:hypothetical protein [Tanacetum cinerariifolium]